MLIRFICAINTPISNWVELIRIELNRIEMYQLIQVTLLSITMGKLLKRIAIRFN